MEQKIVDLLGDIDVFLKRVYYLDLKDKAEATALSKRIGKEVLTVPKGAETLKEIQIWMEGYVATGESGTAQMIGAYYATDFDDAIRQYNIDHPKTPAEPVTADRFVSVTRYEQRRSNWEIWACALFDNEKDARKAFG